MIPLGYFTIPEAITFLEFTFGGREPCGEWTAFEWLEAALLDGQLEVFTERAREYDLEICRIPHEDVKRLSANWQGWLYTGRVPLQPPVQRTPKSKAEFAAWLANPQGPMPEGEHTARTIEHAYENRQLLVASDKLDRWHESLRRQLGLQEPAISKTGAPGRPSSMGIVLTEFERRRGNGGCESSRQAEAEALAAWLAQNHPEAPMLKAKSIFNKLPADFQPFKGDYPKL